MFSRLVTATLTPFRSISHRHTRVPIPGPEEQLLAELARVAEQGMVATRSQDRTPRSPKRNGEKATAVEETPLGKVSEAARKRKRSEPETTRGAQGNGKRRRSSANSERPVNFLSAKELENGSRIPNDGIEVRIVTNETSPTPVSLEQDQTTQTQDNSKSTIKSPKKKRRQAINGESQQAFAAAGPKSAAPGDAKSSGKPVKAKHKKFDEDEPMLATESNAPNISPDAEVEDPSPQEEGGESDDEAPDAIAASTGLNQARHAVEEAGKASKRQQAEQKRKRRERDLRLKIQSKAAKKHVDKDQTVVAVETESAISPDTLVGSAQTQDSQDRLFLELSATRRLPLLLPDELLNSEPTVQPPSPPTNLPLVKADASRKRKLLDIESQPPKDLKRGALKIRVLPADPGHLPPKPSSKQSRMLRESWLTGQRGLKGGIERRKVHGGFVRPK